MAVCTLAQAEPTIYVGSLSSSDGGLVGTGGWVANPEVPATFSWVVTQNEDLSWHYHYEFNTTDLQGSLSHLVLETSGNLAHGDIVDPSYPIEPGDPAWYSEANGNPNIPAAVFGVKFQGFDESETTAIDFDSPRQPMWGDFYAKDGIQGGQLWNAGFTSADPLVPPQSGSIDHHVLVPDTATSVVPAPGAMILGSIGAGLISWLRRRRTL